MSNKIVENYFEQGDFSHQAARALQEIAAETGFLMQGELERRHIYDRSKIRSISYSGTLDGKPAVLILQGIKLEDQEGDMLRAFHAQNSSSFVRVPFLYADRAWDDARGYSYVIVEAVNGRPIFQRPFAAPADMLAFAKFYNEYRTHSIARPWVKPEPITTLDFVKRRVNTWRSISESKGRLTPSDYLERVELFQSIAQRRLANVNMIFSHGHLTSNDILTANDGTFVMLANEFWTYRPQWYDLSFNLWSCFLSIRDTAYTPQELLSYFDEWMCVLANMPIAQADAQFASNMRMMMLERTIGAILTDIGASDAFASTKQLPYYRHLLHLHQQFFDHLAEQLT